MSLSAINQSSSLPFDAPPAAVTLINVSGDRVEAVLLLDGPLGKSGTPVIIKQVSGAQGLTIREIVQGASRNGRDIPASGPGSVLVFEQGALRDGVLMVGRLATRVHDGHQNPLQVGYLLAKPSRINVSKAGARQVATLVDPSLAKVVRTADEFAAFAEAHLSGAWPGGNFGLVMRARPTRDRRDDICVDVQRDDDGRKAESVGAFVDRMVRTNNVLDDAPIELIPYWVLPMGQEQMARETDLREEGPSKVGRFGSHYGKVQTSFQPSLVLISDEDEWAFKAKTGKRPRSVVGMHPLRTDFKMSFKTLPSQFFTGETLVAPKWLYKKDEDIAEALAGRLARSPKAPDAAAETAGEARPRPAGMGLGSLGGLGRR